MPMMRYDPTQQQWVIIAAERGQRPMEFSPVSEEKQPKFCPFCPGNEEKIPKPIRVLPADGEKDWQIRVLPNKFPALKIEGTLDRAANGLYDVLNGVGAHEVIIDSPDHNATLADMPVQDIELLLETYRERLEDLLKDMRLRFISIFKNYGQMAGASLSHPHSQVIATPVIPNVLAVELKSAFDHFHIKERCLFCDIIRQELHDGQRIVLENEAFVVLCPYAARVPFEMQIYPKTHAHCYSQASKETLRLLAETLKEAIMRMKLALGDPPFNLTLHTAPNTKAGARRVGYWNTLEYDYHWHIEILPRLSRIAGFEWGTGFYINPVQPEEAAAHLRKIELA